MHDVIIIGSGSARYTAAIYACRAGRKTLVVAGSIPGVQLMITSDVENCTDFPQGAMEDANCWANITNSVTVGHRRDTRRASKIVHEIAIANLKSNFVWDLGVKEITGEEKVKGVLLDGL